MPNSRRRCKTRTGCSRCKQRRIKCDETMPQCNQCASRAFECPGYKRLLKWSSKYEQPTEGHHIRGDIPGFEDEARSLEKSLSQQSTRPESSCSLHSMATTGQTLSGFVQQALAGNGEGNGDEMDINSPLGYYASDASTSLPSPLSQFLGHQDTRLRSHYFTRVCRINCCFDSPNNYFRVWARDRMDSCPLTYHCALSMSAAHLAGGQRDLSTAALEHRSAAISCLKSNLIKPDWEASNDETLDHDKIGALLGSILLGMTDACHDPSFLGVACLHGTRALFKKWLSSLGSSPDGSASVACYSRLGSFVTGIMAYWEAIASFLIDQPLDAISYLSPLCHQKAAHRIYPNPWTGICSPIFVYFAQVGTLGRQHSMIKNISSTTTAHIQRRLRDDLVEQAKMTERAILDFTVPDENTVEDTNDPLTTICHLQKVAKVYRLVALVELYRVFPELLHAHAQEAPLNAQTTSSREDGSFHSLEPRVQLLAIATSILAIISTIPQESGANVLLAMPLMIAGSILQPGKHPISPGPGRSSWGLLSAEILSLPAQEDIYMQWRDFVRMRINAIRNRVGLAVISRALEIMEKVLARADIQAVAEKQGDHSTGLSTQFVHWTDVMVEERLETVFG